MPVPFFEKITAHYREQLPFVMYCKPGSFKINAVLQRDDTLYKVDDFTTSGFVFAPFDFRKDTVLLPYSKSTVLSMDEHVYLHEDTPMRMHSGPQDADAYRKLVEKGIATIASGSMEKVVLSRKEAVTIDHFDPVEFFQILLNTYASALVYCWYHPKVGLWLGASPESFLSLEGQRFETMALAGTQVYGGTTDVTWNRKEIQEHRFVIDYIQSNLTAFAESIEVSEPETVRAGNLLHLCARISGRLRPEVTNYRNLVFQFHPTPAVCGTPKMEALQFILDNEGYNREFYAGFLGELNKEIRIDPAIHQQSESYADDRRSTQLFVNLRCMQVTGDQAYIYVGGGVTGGSVPEKEWFETVEKANTLKKVIAF